MQLTGIGNRNYSVKPLIGGQFGISVPSQNRRRWFFPLSHSSHQKKFCLFSQNHIKESFLCLVIDLIELIVLPFVNNGYCHCILGCAYGGYGWWSCHWCTMKPRPSPYFLCVLFSLGSKMITRTSTRCALSRCLSLS
ncbi:unnamed protein product [Brassica oleracea]|uniref:(rape) hypothetical protein n=1 Tax=Brassica napus TaxID=3708 RepID=A0A816IL73_BRANA|nr:unnamed protein product [Brassica napus]